MLHSRRGMTLVELAVALAIAGAVVAATHGVASAVLDATSRAMASTTAAAAMAAKRAMLIEWLEGARLRVESPKPAFQGLDGMHGDAPDDQLVFLTATPTPVSDRPTEVVLFVDRDSLTPERGLVAELRAEQGERRQRLAIEPSITGIESRYFSWILGEGQWLPGWISSTVLPVAVELSFVSVTPDSLPALLRPPLLAILEPGR